MIKVKEEFSTHSKEYGNHNIIQQIIAKALVREITSNPKRILELGCGSGQIYNNINFPIEYYKAVDFSQAMCDLHPKCDNTDVCCFDFDSDEFFKSLQNDKYDMVLSSSAMQWSKDLSKLVSFLLSISKGINATLFTSNTFKSIFEITKQKSPILTKEDIIKAFEENIDCKFEIYEYKLELRIKSNSLIILKKAELEEDLPLCRLKNLKSFIWNIHITIWNLK